MTSNTASTKGRRNSEIHAAIEAILMVADSPVSVEELAVAIQQPTESVAGALRELVEQYCEDNRGFELREVGQGWRFYSHPNHSEVVEHFVLEGQTARLTNAALETLTIIAYEQPVSRGKIASIRGVNVDGVIRTLMSRGLIEEVGRTEETGAVVYGTTEVFLEKLGIRDVSALPPLAPYLPEPDALDPFIEEGS